MEIEYSSETSEELPFENKGRKRIRRTEQWVKNKKKSKKDSGKAYTTYRGERKGRKQPAIALTCRCQHHCSSLVTVTDRQQIFNDFYKLGSHDTQNKYLFGLIERCTPKQSRQRRSTGKPRSNTYRYFVRNARGEKIQVCKNAFCEVHAIGKRRVEVLSTKLASGVLFSGENRGLHRNRPHTITDEVKVQVREHIESFPAQESHYSRQDNRRRKYLPETLSIARMYRMFLEKYEPEQEHEKPRVKEWLYRKIFNEEYNIGFGYPRSDTCEKCDMLKVGSDNATTEEERSEIQVELADHQEKAAHGYSSLRADSQRSKTDPCTAVITFDLQQNLPVPTLTHGPMFYLRQLWVYNLGIHNCTNETAVMCMWDETIAGRGANEIISCLMEYISELPPSVKTLTCYSDSCFGQNKNTQIICFWTHLIAQKRFSRIDHKYLVRGHTYLPNDRDFAQIEKRKASAKINLPQDWESVVRESCPSKPFVVKKMTRDKFYNVEPLTQHFTMRKKDHKGLPVLISKAHWLNFGEGEEDGEIVGHPGEYWMRSSFSEEEAWQKINIFKGRHKVSPPTNLELPINYPNGHPINPKKVADLQTMIPYLPRSARDFYVSLKDHPVSN